ncbi:MAG: hypothetical protein P4L84_24505 [Isosphaeraceae bacterium]|nr:hypothetical protein [Isosphaeraceae bacterium]
MNCKQRSVLTRVATFLVLAGPPFGLAQAAEPTAPVRAPSATAKQSAAAPTARVVQSVEAPRTISLLDGLRNGTLAVDARGTGGGRMTLDVTNRSARTLRVVLPPGLVASGATGQFGGLGGNNNAGGMNNNNMGGMNNNMGGMGNNNNAGGMNGMNMNNNMGGTMSTPMNLPATQGMVILGQLIMRLVQPGSWDTRSLTTGLNGLGGMGGVGGGMAGMGGVGGAGGMGGGFRSLPPADLPTATLGPKAIRRLPALLVSLNGPGADGRAIMPALGEPLRLNDISRTNSDAWTALALRRLAVEQVPPSVAQLVLWHVSGGFTWETVDRLTSDWTNAEERALARRFAERLVQADEAAAPSHSAVGLYWEATNLSGDHSVRLTDLRERLEDRTVLGLRTREGIPPYCPGAALALRMRLEPRGALVRVSSWDQDATAWIDRFEFKAKLDPGAHGPEGASKLIDSLAGELLDRLVPVRLVVGPKTKGKNAYLLKIRNESPLIVNGLLLGGPSDASSHQLTGLGLTPRRELAIPISAPLVKRLGLKDGARALAVNLSGL